MQKTVHDESIVHAACHFIALPFSIQCFPLFCWLAQEAVTRSIAEVQLTFAMHGIKPSKKIRLTYAKTRQDKKYCVPRSAH